MNSDCEGMALAAIELADQLGHVQRQRQRAAQRHLVGRVPPTTGSSMLKKV
jgi:hypothetical protein